MNKKISIVVPCYNEEESLGLLYRELIRVIKELKLDYEILFVDDGSSDNTLNVIKDLFKKDKKVRFISFSRNFGKEAALFAGLENVEGDYIAIMDADMQDPPSLLKEMIKGLNEGYDVVASRRVNRKGEPIIRSFFARMFYKIINKLSKIKMVDGERDFRLMRKKVVKAIIELKEYNRYSKGLFSYIGFKIKYLEYENIKRKKGRTKWKFNNLFVYAIEAITSFSTKPLVISALIGILFFIISLFMILFIIIRTLIWSDPVNGWPSLVCIIFMVSGIQLFCTGIMGIYLSKTYLETKKRAIYIISETEKDL